MDLFQLVQTLLSCVIWWVDMFHFHNRTSLIQAMSTSCGICRNYAFLFPQMQKSDKITKIHLQYNRGCVVIDTKVSILIVA